MMNIQIFRNINPDSPEPQPKLKYGKVRNCEFIWLGPIFILVTNRRRTQNIILHPISYRNHMKACNAQFPEL